MSANTYDSELQRLTVQAESVAAAHRELKAWLQYATALSEQLLLYRGFTTRAMAAMKALHEAAQPDEDTPDIDAVIPGGRFAEFVDAHAALLYALKHCPADPTPPSSDVKGHP